MKELGELKRILKKMKQRPNSGSRFSADYEKEEDEWRISQEEDIRRILHARCQNFLAQNEFWKYIIDDVSQDEVACYFKACPQLGWLGTEDEVYYIIPLSREFGSLSLTIFIAIPVHQVLQKYPDIAVAISVSLYNQQLYTSPIVATEEDNVVALENVLAMMYRVSAFQGAWGSIRV